jgi:excinuclease ABC subunit C
MYVKMKKEIFKKEYLKDLPESSGVYFFLQKNKNKKEILYIGKATNLKDRVSSYFSNDIIKTRGVKILSMIENANNIEFIVTRNVLEAIMLESKLIKEHQPNFNTKEKDNKSYSCVVITKEDFPRVLVKRMREIENVKDLDFEIDETFGPFTSKDQLLKSLKIIRKIFPYRDKCKVSHMDYQQPLLSKRGVNTIAENKPCFNFQIGLCPGTCCNKISKLAYVKNIKHIKNILNGETEKLLKDLQKEMKSFAKVKDFENAGSVRDKIYSIEHIKDIALITEEKKSSEDNLSKLDTISVYKNSEKSTSFETEIKVFDKNNITVESYDVAHISGSYRVGVMCKFEIEKISENNFELNYKKDEYKKFKLLEKVNDDILGLKELLERRFKHKE